jgi:phage tail sheath gpL-like
MANSQSRITITHASTETIGTIQDLLASEASKPHTWANKVKNFMQAIKGGARPASISFAQDATADVSATGTITFSSLANNDTITVGGVVFTAKTSGATGAQFNLGSNDTDAAANAVVVLNAHATVGTYVRCTSALGVITLTAARAGAAGNLIGLAISAHGSVSAATLASGANAIPSVPVTFSFGQ